MSFLLSHVLAPPSFVCLLFFPVHLRFLPPPHQILCRLVPSPVCNLSLTSPCHPCFYLSHFNIYLFDLLFFSSLPSCPSHFPPRLHPIALLPLSSSAFTSYGRFPTSFVPISHFHEPRFVWAPTSNDLFFALTLTL